MRRRTTALVARIIAVGLTGTAASAAGLDCGPPPPVKPALSLQIDAAAKAGMTRDAWLLQAIQVRLGSD